jgi:hypothetical protein
MKTVELEEKVNGFTERDTHSKALLNTDLESYLNYKKRKQKVISQNKEMDNMKSQINEMRGEMSEIRDLLQQLLRK